MPRTRVGSNGLTIAQLEALLETKHKKIAKFERQRSKLQKKLAALDAKIISLGGSAGGRSGKGSRAHNEKSLPESIAQVLSGRGTPLKVGAIVDAVLATGYKTNSDNFRGIVNQALIKDKRFHSAGRGLYQMKK